MSKLPVTRKAAPAHYREIDSESSGQRLDNFLLGALKGVPRSHVYRLIRSGQVRVNKGRVRAGYRLKEGDRVRVPPVSTKPTPGAVTATAGVQWLAERILYEDARLLVLDKPAGMAVHAGSGISFGCIEALRSLRPDLRESDLVHRLDRGTSGCLLIAKRRSVLRQLHSVFRDGAVEKRYLALLCGQWAHGQVDIDVPLSTERLRGESFVRVHPEGKSASSNFRVVEHFGTLATLMEVLTATGRTHQIRVHATHAGHPIGGDDRYGADECNSLLGTLGLRRLFLHASSIEFVRPGTEEVFSASAPLPEDLARALDAVRRRSVERAGRRRVRAGRRKAR